MISYVGAPNRGLNRIVKTLERQEAIERNEVRTLETHRDRLSDAMEAIDRELAAKESRLDGAAIAMFAVSRNAAFRADDHRKNLAKSLATFDAERYEPARERVREVAVRRRSIEALAERRARAESERLARSEQQRMDEAGARTWFRQNRIG